MNAETETYKGHEIEIQYDQNPESPREWDNICVFHVAHRRYSFGDKNYNDSESIHEAQRTAERDLAFEDAQLERDINDRRDSAYFTVIKQLEQPFPEGTPIEELDQKIVDEARKSKLFFEGQF